MDFLTTEPNTPLKTTSNLMSGLNGLFVSFYFNLIKMLIPRFKNHYFNPRIIHFSDFFSPLSFSDLSLSC